MHANLPETSSFFLSAQMVVLSRFLRIFIIHGMYNFGREAERERESKGEVTKNIPLTEDLFSTSQRSLNHIVLSPLKTSIKETYKNSIHLLLRTSKHNLDSIFSTVLNMFMELMAPPT